MANGVFQSKSGVWWIDYYANGNRHREKIGPNKTIATEIFNIRKADIARGTFVQPSERNQKNKGIKFKDFAETYLTRHSKINNIKSWKTADSPNINQLKIHFGNKCLEEISPRLIADFKSVRIKEVSGSTVNRQLRCLRSMFYRAIEWGDFNGKNPVKHKDMFNEPPARDRFLEKDEIGKLLSNCAEPLRTIVLVAIHTGMRKGEIMGLKWRDIDFKRGIVHLFKTKNDNKREIPLNNKALNAISATRKHPKSEYVFTKKDGTKYGDFKKSFCTVLRKSAIKNFRFHDLRSTFASHLVLKGVPLNTVSELLGHKSLEMTRRYAYLNMAHKQSAVDCLSDETGSIWSSRESHQEALLSTEADNALVANSL